MQAILVTLLGAVLTTGLPAFSDAPAAPATPLPATAQSRQAAEKKLTPEELVAQLADSMKKVCQILETVKDKESAEQASKTVMAIKKECFRLMALSKTWNKEDREKLDLGMSKEEVEKIDSQFRKESDRLEEAQYYGSSALRDVIKDDELPEEEDPFELLPPE